MPLHSAILGRGEIPRRSAENGLGPRQEFQGRLFVWKKPDQRIALHQIIRINWGDVNHSPVFRPPDCMLDRGDDGRRCVEGVAGELPANDGQTTAKKDLIRHVPEAFILDGPPCRLVRNKYRVGSRNGPAECLHVTLKVAIVHALCMRLSVRFGLQRPTKPPCGKCPRNGSGHE